MGVWAGFIWLGIGTGGWLLWLGNELSVSTKWGEYFDWL